MSTHTHTHTHADPSTLSDCGPCDLPYSDLCLVSPLIPSPPAAARVKAVVTNMTQLYLDVFLRRLILASIFTLREAPVIMSLFN